MSKKHGQVSGLCTETYWLPRSSNRNPTLVSAIDKLIIFSFNASKSGNCILISLFFFIFQHGQDFVEFVLTDEEIYLWQQIQGSLTTSFMLLHTGTRGGTSWKSSLSICVW